MNLLRISLVLSTFISPRHVFGSIHTFPKEPFDEYSHDDDEEKKSSIIITKPENRGWPIPEYEGFLSGRKTIAESSHSPTKSPSLFGFKTNDGGLCEKPSDCASGICLGYTYYPGITPLFGVCCSPKVNTLDCRKCQITDNESNEGPKYFPGECVECKKNSILVKGTCVESFKCHLHCPTGGFAPGHACCLKCTKPCVDGYSCIRTSKNSGKCKKETVSPSEDPAPPPFPNTASTAPSFRPSIPPKKK